MMNASTGFDGWFWVAALSLGVAVVMAVLVLMPGAVKAGEGYRRREKSSHRAMAIRFLHGLILTCHVCVGNVGPGNESPGTKLPGRRRSGADAV